MGEPLVYMTVTMVTEKQTWVYFTPKNKTSYCRKTLDVNTN